MTVMMRVAVLAGLVAALTFAESPASGGLTAQEKRGKQIYLRGINAAGEEITAYLGDPPMEVPGSLMACANCHGYDGRGKPEGGVTPSDVTWQVLTKSYGVTHESGRRHPPYNEVLLDRAIAVGLDPAGHTLTPAMPRYRLSREDMSDLIAYIKRVGNDKDPGLTDDTITLGTFVPASGPLAEMGEAIRAVLSAYFADINEQGGVYNRKIELRVAQCGQTVVETRNEVDRFVDEEQIFAMVGAFTAGADQEIASLLAEKEVPLVGPSTLNPQIGYPLNRQVFYLFSGIKEESRALVSFAAGTLGTESARTAILFPDDASNAEIAEAVESQCRQSGWEGVAKVRYAPRRFDAGAVARQLRDGGADVVFVLGSGHEAAALAEEAGKLGWKPSLFLPGAMAGRDVLEATSSFLGKIYLSFPMRSSDQTPEAAMQFRAFAGRHKLAGKHLAAMISAYSGAKVLVQGLKLAGRDLSREKLIVALEGMYKFDTGLTPPITYTPNRRIGARGAYVVEFQLANRMLAPAGGWIEVE